MNLNKLIKIADWYLYKDVTIRRLVKEKRAGFIANTLPGDIKSNPTENTAIKHLSEVTSVVERNGKIIYFPERWIILFDKLYNSLEGQFLAIATARYNRKEKYVVTCARLEITANKYFAVLKEIRVMAVIYAVELGLIKTKSK